MTSRFGHEACLDVELGELGLAVGPEILVAKTPGQLIVPLDSPGHQYLLEELRRLWKREVRARLEPGRHQEIPRSFGRAFGEARRFHLDEALGIEKRPEGGGEPMPETQIRLHRVGAKVHGSMLKPALLGHLLPFLRPKRQIGCDGEHFQSICLKFDVFGVQAGVFGSRRTEAQDAGEHHDPFRADAASLLCRFR